MRLKWLGHSCFLLTTEKESWLSDPFAPAVGYPIPQVSPTVVTVSHGHYDHNDTSWVPEAVPVLSGASWQGKGLRLSAVASFHDESGGRERGGNYIYIARTDVCTVVHLGDLGHLLQRSQLSQLGRVDVLLLPVGGIYTVGPREAWSVVEQLGPRIVVPMHYQTKRLSFRLGKLEDFLALAPPEWSVAEQAALETETDLAADKIVVLKYI